MSYINWISSSFQLCNVAPGQNGWQLERQFASLGTCMDTAPMMLSYAELIGITGQGASQAFSSVTGNGAFDWDAFAVCLV